VCLKNEGNPLFVYFKVEDLTPFSSQTQPIFDSTAVHHSTWKLQTRPVCQSSNATFRQSQARFLVATSSLKLSLIFSNRFCSGFVFPTQAHIPFCCSPFSQQFGYLACPHFNYTLIKKIQRNKINSRKSLKRWPK